MIVLGFLARVPIPVLAVLSIGMIVTHNLADAISASQFGAAAWAWNILHQPGIFRVSGVAVAALYPLVPWIAVMSAGYCFGPIMRMDPSRRRR